MGLTSQMQSVRTEAGRMGAASGIAATIRPESERRREAMTQRVAGWKPVQLAAQKAEDHQLSRKLMGSTWEGVGWIVAVRSEVCWWSAMWVRPPNFGSLLPLIARATSSL